MVMHVIPAGLEIYSREYPRRAPGIYGGKDRRHFTSSTRAQEAQMAQAIGRRDFLKLAGLGGVGVVFASALPGVARADEQDAFYFFQLSESRCWIDVWHKRHDIVS